MSKFYIELYDKSGKLVQDAALLNCPSIESALIAAVRGCEGFTPSGCRIRPADFHPGKDWGPFSGIDPIPPLILGMWSWSTWYDAEQVIVSVAGSNHASLADVRVEATKRLLKAFEDRRLIGPDVLSHALQHVLTTKPEYDDAETPEDLVGYCSVLVNGE